MAVTGAAADRLSSSLGLVGQAFKFDLSKVGQAAELVDKMTVAGRGAGGLQSISDILERVGVNAAAAGFSYDKTLAFIKTLSKIEQNPKRLAALTESTLGFFGDLDKMKQVTEATGVKFYDKKGKKRDSIDVLRDVKAQYDTLGGDTLKQEVFMKNVFGGNEKGLRELLSGNALADVEKYVGEIKNATGTIARDLPAAVRNAVVATGRLKAELGKAADSFAQPINEAYTNLVGFALDKKEDGGLGLDGTDLIAGGAGLALDTFAAARYGSKGISALAKKFGGTATGIAEGKALQAAAGVTPVFVVNWPASIGGMDIPGMGEAGIDVGTSGAAKTAGKVAGKAKTLAALAGAMPLSAWGTSAGALGTAAGGVALAGAAGYGVGTGIDWAGEKLAKGTRMEGVGTDVIGGAVARIAALFGSEDAKRALAADETIQRILTETAKKEVKVDSDLHVVVEGSVKEVRARSNNPNVSMSVDTGFYMQMSN